MLMLPPQITVELLSGDAPQPTMRCASYQECLLVPRRIIKGNLQVGGKQLGFKNVKAVHLQKMGKSGHRFEEASGDFI